MGIPHVRFAVNSICGFKCSYCLAWGESSFISPDILSKEEIFALLAILKDCGIRFIKYTGGDPLLRKDILEILDESYRLGFPHVELITNGPKLCDVVESQQIHRLSRLTVSLDTLKAERFESLYKRDCFQSVKEAIVKAAQNRIKVRINMVLMRLNLDEIEDMILFAEGLGVELKIIELLEFQVPDREFWLHNYVEPEEIVPRIETYSVSSSSNWGEGDLGSPMRVFTTGSGGTILIYESSFGTHFGSVCEGCKHYPCQDGLYGLRISHDGKLKICWARNDNLIDILTPLRSGSLDEVRKRVNKALDVFASADFRQGYKANLGPYGAGSSMGLHHITRAMHRDRRTNEPQNG